MRRSVATAVAVLLCTWTVGPAAAQLARPVDWADVCTAEDLVQYKDALCRKTFVVSTLAFNPLGPQQAANMTVLLQPSFDMPQTDWLARTQYIDIVLPGFEPVGTPNKVIPSYRDLTVTPMNPIQVGIDPMMGYNTAVNPLFKSVAYWDIPRGTLRLTVIRGMQVKTEVDTELLICCLRLPNQSERDSPKYRISAPTNEGPGAISITDEAVKSTPYIDAGFQWEFLQVILAPPVSMQLTTISLTLRPANVLKDRQQIVMYMPQIRREADKDGTIEFSTADSANPLDWMLFQSQAIWNNTRRSIHLFLRPGQVLAAGRQVTVKTIPGDFRLPISMDPNSNMILVEARSLDSIDEIIAKTVVDQSSNVPRVRTFVYSEFRYRLARPNERTDVTFRFLMNRPLFADQTLYVRMSGFRSDVVDIVLIGPTKFNFQNDMARWYMPENLMVLSVVKTLYCDEQITEIIFSDMSLPPALYANDPSLLLWTSDPDAPQESVLTSPELCGKVCGGEQKTFGRSQIAFTPAEPRLPANVTFTILPSIYFYQNDMIVLHLYGFVCTSVYIPLDGPGASQIDQGAARWNGDEYTLTLVVAENEIIDNVLPFIITITEDKNFRLPGLLSKNDGTLRIEGRGALITERPLLKVPAMGDPKSVISSRVDIEPYWPSNPQTPFARVIISFILNSDVLPGSSITIRLGGLLRNPPEVQLNPIGWSTGRSGKVQLLGKNAPLFYRQGDWNHDACVLTLKTKPEYIFAGETIVFFLERDEFFQLPPAAYQNDPAFRIAIPGAGIAEEQFLYSTKWIDNSKTWVQTEVWYGDPGSVWYPGDAPDFNMRFQSNVDLYAGSIITLRLPGFKSTGTTIFFSAPDKAVSNEYDISSFIRTAAWNPFTEELQITVPVGNAIIRRTNVMRIRAFGTFGFMLPTTQLYQNDPRLTIRVNGNQFIYEEPLQKSPRIVKRTFLVSEFQYRPPIKEGIFLFVMKLVPSVNISYPSDIVINLPGFRNSLSKQQIEITGASRRYIKLAQGFWNETTEMLTLPTIFNGPVMPLDVLLQFEIKESQGFILPSMLQQDGPSIRIRSVNNILWEPIKKSPMVGDMPYAPHRFCMIQYEESVRTRMPLCPSAADCDPPLTDPCSATELARCGCDTRLDEKFNFTISGFNLVDTDMMYFLPYEQLCSLTPGPLYLQAFTLQTDQPMVSTARDRAEFYGFRCTKPGYYRMCYKHAGILFDVGFVKVTPACGAPYVSVGGVCVENCPSTKIPYAGECIKDPLALDDSDTQALMLSVVMADPMISGTQHLSIRNSDDQEYQYYVYRFTYELARLLNCDPSRINVASISHGSTVSNVVFTPVAGNGRSPQALISLLRALQSDASSSFYQNAFFQVIKKPDSINQIVTRRYNPAPLKVRLCRDGEYRVFCPYAGDLMPLGSAYTIFVVLMLVFPVLLGLLGCCCWIADFDRRTGVDEETYDKLRTKPAEVEDTLKQIEFARSWLEGRFMGEQWQKARDVPFLGITAN